MKLFFCILSLFFIIYTEITMWAFARSHPEGHAEIVYTISLDFGQGVMEKFDTRIAARRRRSNRSIIENHQSEEEDGFQVSDKNDYEVSDPPPATKRPSKKPVQYRIFTRPPAGPRP
eukprot:Gb_33481 [translate_table: standard]